MSQNLAFLIDRRKKIRASIAEVLEAGQSMSLDDGISYTRANLTRLRDLEKEINNEIARATGARPLFQSVAMRTPYR